MYTIIYLRSLKCPESIVMVVVRNAASLVLVLAVVPALAERDASRRIIVNCLSL